MALDPSPISVFSGPFTADHATRLLWRAGFGPKPGDAVALAQLGLDGAVASLTRPTGRPSYVGAAPHGDQGQPIDPLSTWGDAHVWWLDRMVRSSQPLVERMTLIWHSWFATSVQASTPRLIINQYWMLRAFSLASFSRMLLGVTQDPAMLAWLSGSHNTKYSPNENYAREMMELFTLGADRGYTQDDVREQARALTGWTSDWVNGGPTNFRFDPALHDAGVKTIFGQTGNFDWQDSCRLCLAHPDHPSFMVTKLWGYFIGAPIPADALSGLTSAYVRQSFQIRPLVEAILRHPLFYDGPRMVIPPVVYVAGLHRATQQTITTTAWSWLGKAMGQLLFDPPNVAGWDYSDWLDTARWTARLDAVNYILQSRYLNPKLAGYPADETSAQALATALAFWGNPALSTATTDNLLAFGDRVQSGITANWEQVPYRVGRQNALRSLIPTTPDWQTC